MSIKRKLKFLGLLLWGWLVDRWAYVAIVCLVVLAVVGGLTVLKTKETKDATVQAVAENRLTKAQAQQTEAANLELAADTTHKAALIQLTTAAKDSTVRVAHRLKAKVDSLVTATPAHETYAAADSAAAKLESALSGYRPGAFATPAGDTIR